MKKISVILASLALVFAMTSCDKLKEPYKIEPPVIVVDTNLVQLTAEDTLNFDGKIVVLLEDYTGVRCVNCPEAAEIASQLQEQNEGHLIVLGVHPNTAYQIPYNDVTDFRTEEGNDWNNYFNIDSYPSGTVNRKEAIGNPEWTAAVNNVIGSDAPVRLIVKTAYNESEREVSLSVYSKFLTTVESDDVRLTLCMMEDSIVGPQQTTTGVNTNYMHRHVFRGTVDGLTWGRVLDINSGSTIESGRYFATNMKFNVDEKYNADQFYIVAFITDHNTRQVLMAAEAKIK
ncbi:MAG: Omp28 family outer membrane lipoprotein [Bacteroidales bacterium]|nr:Omp28 family outer membrane lipoprotein [Bacteroidales bacterium]MBO7530005.1 Omp28 family outer membrane lipoprotein [Bacteroidales bacterium]